MAGKRGLQPDMGIRADEPGFLHSKMLGLAAGRGDRPCDIVGAGEQRQLRQFVERMRLAIPFQQLRRGEQAALQRKYPANDDPGRRQRCFSIANTMS